VVTYIVLAAGNIQDACIFIDIIKSRM